MRKHFIPVALFVVLATMAVSCQKESDDAPILNGDKINIEISGIKHEMVLVKAGSFTMGAINGDTLAANTETPAHQVTLSQDYYIGTTEVTQELYEAVMGENPSHFKGATLPVDGVSYSKALSFCARLSELTDMTFSLPTEAQWEYAARGGHKTPLEPNLYAGSNDIESVAWYWGNSQHIPDSGSTYPVAMKQPNSLGIYDMSGNVWEWCLDWSGYYNADPEIDPVGPTNGQYRVLRGGSWYNYAWRCRVTYRYNNYPEGDDYVHVIGFRIVALKNNNKTVSR